MKFNEWLTQKTDPINEEDILENQMEQWINKLMGLLHTVPAEKKQKFLERVISELKTKL